MVEKEEDVTSEDAESTIDENGVENASDSASSNEGTTVDTGDTPMKAEESEESATEQNELSISEHATIDKAIKKQKDFTEGKIKKSKLSKKDQNDVEAVEKSGAYHKEVQLKDSDRWGNTYDSKVKVVVVPKLTDALLEDAKQYNHNSIGYSLMSSGRYHDNVEVVQKGLMLGKKLGKKLQIRNEERTTKWTRQESGRIDKRLIAELGFDNGNVFSHSFTTKYNDAYLHISIDASGSMSGEYYENAIKSAAAICQAADMVGNIHVQVTVRTTLNSADSPLLAVVYDSKVNKIVHIKKYWRYLDAKGTTPEGLCFAAIEKQIFQMLTVEMHSF